jgi:hypothetical protein
MEFLGIIHGNKIQIFRSRKQETVFYREEPYGNLQK